MIDAAAQVALAYRAVLRREPDAGGLAAYTAALSAGRSRERKDLAWLIGVLAGCDEFKALDARLAATNGFPLDRGPPLAVRSVCTPAEQQALWDALAVQWAGLGAADPHWSVLTEDRFHRDRMDGAALAAFHATGEGEVDRLNAWLRRAGWTLPANAVCAELGCGVGRITRALARQCGRVIGLDVSAPHLAMARAQMAADAIGNGAFVQVRGPADLACLAGIDLFYSVISLQHSPPPIIHEVLARAFDGLRPGGCAFFQVPTYARGYRYDPAHRPGGDEMEMHLLPQRTILDLAHRAGLVVAEVQPDWCAGRPGEWISSTFLLLRPANEATSAVD